MANIKADEITKILREQIENYQQAVMVEEVGSTCWTDTNRLFSREMRVTRRM